jgi:hypothetical protein
MCLLSTKWYVLSSLPSGRISCLDVRSTLPVELTVRAGSSIVAGNLLVQLYVPSSRMAM